MLRVISSKTHLYTLGNITHCSVRTVTDDVRDVWRRVTGEELVLKKREGGAGLEAQ